MSAPLQIRYVSPPSDYAKVHRLTGPPTEGLLVAYGRKLACGRTFRFGHGAAGWEDYDETRPGFCNQCRKP